MAEKNISITEPISVYRKVLELAENAGDLDSIGHIDTVGDMMRHIFPALYFSGMPDISMKALPIIALVSFIVGFGLIFIFSGEPGKITAIIIFISVSISGLSLGLALFIPPNLEHSKISGETFPAREKYSTQAVEEIHRSALDANEYDIKNLEPKLENLNWKSVEYHGGKSDSIYPTGAVLHWVDKESEEIVLTTSHQEDKAGMPIESIEVIHGTKDVARVGQ